MALPILGVVAGVAARAAAKKVASRVVGGITGKGAKQVNPVYRNQTDQIQKNSVKVQKNSFDTYSTVLGRATLREIHGRMNKEINRAGLEKARSKESIPSVKIKSTAKPKAKPIKLKKYPPRLGK